MPYCAIAAAVAAVCRFGGRFAVRRRTSMNAQTFESLTRRAAAVSRRASLATLGGAAMTAASSRVSEAKKGGQSCGKKQKKKCNQNKSDCTAEVVVACNGSSDCVTALTPCCDECFSAGFLTCFAALA
jgi:hypothetical protein